MSVPANDAHLIQFVRGAFGREETLRKAPKLNVSSCGMIVSLHGSVEHEETRTLAGQVAASVDGVEGVVNRLSVQRT